MIESFKFQANKSLVSFLFILFWKTKIGPLISLILPFAFMLFWFFISNKNNDTGTFAENLSLYISLTIIPLSLITIPQVLVELKNSILLRKLKISGFTKLNIISIFFGLYFFLNWFLLVWNFLFYLIFLSTKSDFFQTLSSLHWSRILYTTLFCILLSISFGLLLGSIFKNLLMVQIIGVIILLISMSLAGIFIPLELTSKVLALKIISCFSPLNYSINLLVNSIKLTDEATINSMSRIINERKEEFIILTQVFERLNLDIKDPEILNKIKMGDDFFNLNYRYFVFFQLGEIGKTLGFETTDGTEIFDIWQKWLNLIMPYFLVPICLFFSWKYFSWFGR